jgi:hypothetical protein
VKLTFSETLERIHEHRHVNADTVQARALTRTVWVAEWHLPGCLSESFSVSTTKREAIADALGMASGEAGPPRGMLADLRRFGRSDRTAPDAWARGAITTIERRKLADLL